MTEEQLREKIVKLFEHYVRRDNNDEPIWYIDNGDSFYNTIYDIMSLFTHQLNIKDAEHAKALELAKIEQNKFSRGDEFLWFVRKLREFMGDSTSSRYKAFESNFISQYEHKYLEYFKVIDELTNQKEGLAKTNGPTANGAFNPDFWEHGDN